MSEEDWQSIRIVEDEQTAELIEGFLRSQDIPCEAGTAHYSHEFPTHVGKLGEIEIKVPADRADEARRLLEQQEREAEGS